MALQYLLAPTFQFINTAGKPLSGGAYMEVYVHGTRTKYFCASDFDGTLHPFRIPLDSLGSNIVLANDTGSYDVYAYNRYGTLMMSRYNVKPGAGGGIGGTITSTDGSIDIRPTDYGADLSVPEQQQSDWNEFRTDSPSYIRNKPNILLKADRVSGAAPGNLAGLDANGNLVDSGKSYSDLEGTFKTRQTAKVSPTASGNTLSFIDTVSQDENGEITATKKTVTVDSTYSSAGTNPVNGKAVAAAIGGLDVSSVGGDGKYISAISETDGKISATATTMDTTPTANSTKAVTSGGIKTALDDKFDKYGFFGKTDGKWIGAALTVRGETEVKYWKLCSFTTSNYWTLNFVADVTNANFDSNVFERKIIAIHGYAHGVVDSAFEIREGNNRLYSTRGYGNIIYYEISGNNVTIYIKAKFAANVGQYCRLVSVLSLNAISNLTWYQETTAGTQPENPVKFSPGYKTVKPAGSTSVPVYIGSDGNPTACTDDFVHDGDVTSTYSSTGTAPVNGKAVAAAIGGLDVSSVGGDGKYISAISETDGKISATATTMDTAPTANSTKAVTSGGIKTALDGKQDSLPTSGTASSTYAINISGNSTRANNWHGSIYGMAESANTKRYVYLGRKRRSAYGCLIGILTVCSHTDSKDVYVINSGWSDGNFGGGASVQRISSGGATAPINICLYNHEITENDTVYSELWCYIPTTSGEVDFIFRTLFNFYNAVTLAASVVNRAESEFTGTLTKCVNSNSRNISYSPTNTEVGSASVPVYVKGSGAVTACTDDFVHDGDVTSTYSSTGTAPVNGKAVAAAIGGLDVSSVGGDGKYISAISETDGKIAPVVETMDTAPTRGSRKAVTSDGIQTALDEKLDIDDVNSLSLTAAYTEDNHRLTFTDIIFDNIYPVVGKYGLAVFKTDTTTAAIESSGDKDWLLDWRPYLIDMNAVAGETAKKPIAELRKANWLRNIDGSFAPVCGITAAQGACLDGKSASLKWGKADDYGASSDVATDVPEAFDGTEFNPAAFWNYVNSAAGLDRANEVTGAGYRCAIEVEVTDGVTTYKYGAYGNDHIPAPWETTRTDLSVFIGRTTDVYVIDGAEKYGDYMRGLCAKPVPVGTSQFDPEFFKLRRTGISPGPSTTKGGKIRNFFYNYTGTDSNTAGGGNAACFKNNGTYPRTTDASQYTTANWSRACNSGGSSGNAVPVAEGGYFALNAFICSLEAAYKDRNLWSAARFSTGISSNDTVQNGVWNGSAATAYTTWSNGTVGSDNANGHRPKFQCMEPQIAASLAAEMGLAANTAFTWNGGEWHYEVPELTGINSLTGSGSSMNCRIYKKITEGLSSAVAGGGHYMLRCALAEGVNPTGDVWWYQGGGCELVYMTTGTTNTAYTYSFYLEPDQSKWLATSTNEKHTDGTPFPAETAYTAIITDSTAGGLGNGWSNSRTGYTPLRLTAGGSYNSGECMYNVRHINDDSKGSSGIRSRRYVLFRGAANLGTCSPRYLDAHSRPSGTGAHVGCAAQVLLA